MTLKKWPLLNGWTIELLVRDGLYSKVRIVDSAGSIRLERRYAYYEARRAEEEAGLLAWLAQPQAGMEKAA